MFEILIATMLGAVALLWYSTKTDNIAFQKLWAALGILLFALVFLQASVMAPDFRIANETTSYEYFNQTRADAPGEFEWELDNTTTVYQYENDPAGEVISSGNLGLFTVFGMVLFMMLIWFAIDYIGIGLNDFGQITRRKPPKIRR